MSAMMIEPREANHDLSARMLSASHHASLITRQQSKTLIHHDANRNANRAGRLAAASTCVRTRGRAPGTDSTTQT
jgi:hypothetical protein